MSRVYNFSAGPAMLPVEVLKEAASEMLDYQGSGMSVMEMSHRSQVFQNIIDEAEADLRDLLNIPDNYKVLFLQGGASQQIRHFLIFRIVPIFRLMTMQITYISVRIIQSMERSTKNFRIRKARRWLQMYLPVSCQSLTM